MRHCYAEYDAERGKKMIKKSIAVAVIVALFLPLGLASSASAVEKKHPITGTPPKRTTSAPMSEGECVGLGGTVIDYGNAVNCASKKACATVDQNGAVHWVCITATAH